MWRWFHRWESRRLLRHTLKPNSICALFDPRLCADVLACEPAVLHVIAAAAHPSKDTAIVHHRHALSFFESASLNAFDWIYLGEIHDFDAALADLIDAWKLLRPGGLVAGRGHEHADTKEALACFARPYQQVGRSHFWLVKDSAVKASSSPTPASRSRRVAESRPHDRVIPT